ncbi:hypothetical protein BJV82DRAFT_639185 [Fennellomyces sp. T-0311]|nr:hypothetical protein BJV82DRAFT_639185 [Fennellomyces sp. T-0311]
MFNLTSMKKKQSTKGQYYVPEETVRRVIPSRSTDGKVRPKAIEIPLGGGAVRQRSQIQGAEATPAPKRARTETQASVRENDDLQSPQAPVDDPGTPYSGGGGWSPGYYDSPPPPHSSPSPPSHSSPSPPPDFSDHVTRFRRDLPMSEGGEASTQSTRNSKTVSEVEQEWASHMESMADAYVFSYAENRPTHAEASPYAAARCINCDDQDIKEREITCVFYAGIRRWKIPFCKCTSDRETLIRHHVFPATPTTPRTAVHIPFLDFYDALLLETGRVSVQAFANAIAAQHHYERSESIRKAIGNAHFAYKNMLDVISARLQTEDQGCPLCPERGIWIALDGNMQLRRRKLNAEDTNMPDTRTFFSADALQHKYDKEATLPPTSADQSCQSHLRVADLNITNKKIPKFFKNGVVGCTCARHTIPLQFTNMIESGEKFKYPLAVIEAFKKQYGNDDINVMYDIACRFKPALKSTFPELNNSKVAVSVFHAYAHTMSCQVQYHPRYQKGMALTDGEGLERVWSYLGNYVSVTRQMTSQRRQCTLDNAIKHFRWKRLLSMHNTLQRKKANANATKKRASEYLSKKVSELDEGDNHRWWAKESISHEEIDINWRKYCEDVSSYKKNLNPDGSLASANREAQEVTYYLELKEYYSHNDELQKQEGLCRKRSISDDERAEASKKLVQCQKKVASTLRIVEISEKTLGIRRRWKKGSQNWKRASRNHAERQKDNMQVEIRRAVVSYRMMLEQMKGRGGSAPGEKLSSHIATMIQKVTKDIRSYLVVHNDACKELGKPVVTWDDVQKLNSSFWTVDPIGHDFDVLRELMYKMRAEEELDLLVLEEARLCRYVEARCARIENMIKDEQRGHGYRVLLFRALRDAEILWKKTQRDPKAHRARSQETVRLLPSEDHCLQGVDGDDDNDDELLAESTTVAENAETGSENVDDPEELISEAIELHVNGSISDIAF